ncbi:MAG: hypothetical protein NTW52_07710 [Planctomycetota bacterium]|nr:hypothetical protein [Planctomycetota bacterium]
MKRNCVVLVIAHYRYLNQAVYCSYIIHFTMALLASAVVYQLNLEYTPELIAGLVLQTIFSLAFFEIAKRSRLDQVLFGIKLSVRSPTTETASIWWSRLSAAHSVSPEYSAKNAGRRQHDAMLCFSVSFGYVSRL